MGGDLVFSHANGISIDDKGSKFGMTHPFLYQAERCNAAEMLDSRVVSLGQDSHP
jgi:hypothetical protein